MKRAAVAPHGSARFILSLAVLLLGLSAPEDFESSPDDPRGDQRATRPQRCSIMLEARRFELSVPCIRAHYRSSKRVGAGDCELQHVGSSPGKR